MRVGAPRCWIVFAATDGRKGMIMKAATKSKSAKKVAQVQIGAPRTGAGGMSLPFSPAIRAGDFVYVSGQVAFDANGELVAGGIVPQTRQTIENLRKILQQAGCTLDNVIKCNVWLADARDFSSFNKVYASFFPNIPPARSTVQSPLMIDAKIEIDCVAYRPI
jgi:reactive intermediate/imine deaminase